MTEQAQSVGSEVADRELLSETTGFSLQTGKVDQTLLPDFRKRRIFLDYEDWTFGGSSGLGPGDHRIFRWLARRRWRWMARRWRMARRRFSGRILRTRVLWRPPVLECWLLSMERRLALVGRRV